MSNVTKVAKSELSEKIMVSTDVKQVLYSLKTPGERLGDVVDRLIRDRKRDEFIEYLDSRAKKADYVPIESDPEMARMMQERGAC